MFEGMLEKMSCWRRAYHGSLLLLAILSFLVYDNVELIPEFGGGFIMFYNNTKGRFPNCK